MSEAKVENTQRAYSRPEELTNFITYAIAALLSFVGLVFLLLKSVDRGASTVAGTALCGSLFIAVFASGAVLHAMPVGSKARKNLRKFDRCAVSVLILGAFAPVMLFGLGGGTHADAVWGYSLFAVSAAAVVAAAVINVLDVAEYKIISLVLYVVIGAACVVRISRVVELCGWQFFWMLFGGGAAYFVGTVVCAFAGLPARHSVWHMSIICGAILHFLGIYIFLL